MICLCLEETIVRETPSYFVSFEPYKTRWRLGLQAHSKQCLGQRLDGRDLNSGMGRAKPRKTTQTTNLELLVDNSIN